jgi:hypothetical protein
VRDIEGTTDDNYIESESESDEVLKTMGPRGIKTTRVDENGREYTSYDIDNIDILNTMDDRDKFDDINKLNDIELVMIYMILFKYKIWRIYLRH